MYYRYVDSFEQVMQKLNTVLGEADAVFKVQRTSFKTYLPVAAAGFAFWFQF